MSTDTSASLDAPAGAQGGESGQPISTKTVEPKDIPDVSHAMNDDQWKRLRKKVAARNKKLTARMLFGKPAIGGNVYRWGLATSLDAKVDPLRDALSQLACDQKPKRRKSSRPIDFVEPAKQIIDRLARCPSDTVACHDAILWAAAMPMLAKQFEPALWWDLLGTLQQYRESTLQTTAPASPSLLIGGAELGLTLAWRLADLPSCQRLKKSSIESFRRWVERNEEALPMLLSEPSNVRLVLGSLLRCKRLIEKTTKQKSNLSAASIGDEIATWAAAMTTPDGTAAFSQQSPKEITDDLKDYGVLMQATEFAPSSLHPAMQAALGQGHSGGRLAWEVSLPESFCHCEQAKQAILLPEWDVRRGRTHLQYSGIHNTIELHAGRSMIAAGKIETTIEIDGEPQEPIGEWTFTCEHTDDDVHYLEIEQVWSGGVVLQRQWLLIREDRCLVFADSVMPKMPLESDDKNRKILYRTRFPTTEDVSVVSETETREVFLTTGKPKALVMPLSASEWSSGPTMATLSSTDDDALVVEAVGSGALYCPLWFDFQTNRFKRKRTWRNLTVADERRICPAREAVGYRVQIGSEQWMLYRSLGNRRSRTVLGKHLIADFFAARFDMGDGNLEELVTVDDNESNDG
ncbi:hypothetical protein CA13_07340 [Planctomycetes bacterium CA13]|uniref:Heparinase II/III-like protein n=1 Tax=Novipirellula herctigrandis TaxID=2527986 RepID=A0A5C5YWG9_9BACT|nr:hypothetical protein CA13_07340 [Planctomycetes bacterium CA13]